MAYKEDDFLQLSGLQHFAFCRRQWALIHIENQWQENLRTVEGDLFHERAHDEQQRERRGDTLILRGLSVFSASLGLSGKCDVTEFHRDPRGVSLQGEEGLWLPFPVEYKRALRKPEKRTRCSSAPRPCAWRKCFAALFRRAHSSMARPGGGFRWSSRRSCESRYGTSRKKCISIFSGDIRRRESPANTATPVL